MKSFYNLSLEDNTGLIIYFNIFLQFSAVKAVFAIVKHLMYEKKNNFVLLCENFLK